MQNAAVTNWRVAWVVMTAFVLTVAATLRAQDKPAPAVGDKAPAIASVDLDGTAVTLAALVKESPVVVLFLRGNPGYQCPICSRQVAAFMGAAKQIKTAGARVLMVYPGPTEGLRQHAADFVGGKTLPEHFDLVIDPDYVATNAWNLRWNAENETAYPSTFVVDKDNVIRFAKVSTTHDGRSNPKEVIASIEQLKQAK